MLGLAQAGANSSAKLMDEVRGLREDVAQVMAQRRASAFYGEWAAPGLFAPNVAGGQSGSGYVLPGSGFEKLAGAPALTPRVVTHVTQEELEQLGRKVEELERKLGINLGVSREKKEDEQAGEEQQKREQHRVHAPSLKRAGEQGKMGGEKK